MKIRIKENCQRCGITQKDLAAVIGVSEVTLTRASNGYASLQLLEKIAQALNISMSELFEQPQMEGLVCPHCGKTIKVKFEK